MSAPPAQQPPPAQRQDYPGRTSEMLPEPRDEMRDYEGRDLLRGAGALITGGDSGLGRAVAVAFSTEQWERTFRVNIFSFWASTEAASWAL